MPLTEGDEANFACLLKDLAIHDAFSSESIEQSTILNLVLNKRAYQKFMLSWSANVMEAYSNEANIFFT